MIQILSCLHKYVPTVEESNEEIYVPSRRESASMPREILHKILFGGDQLTVARMRVHKQQKLIALHLLEEWKVLSQ